MKLQYKIQQYQSDAVAAVVDCFDGQPKQEPESYIREHETAAQGELLDNAFRNAPITLDEGALLENINKVQERQRLPLSTTLNKADDIPINLDIEMETGTGKTYCYTKTIFELNQKYGWTKFIIIVPSVAIREGVYFSIKSTEEHFKGQYGKTLSTFLYHSDRPNDLKNFEGGDDLTVMIMNYQAFAAPPESDARSTKTQRKIYGSPDGFGSRRPIDIIASARPILLLDEPQRLEGKATVEALPLFNPLMALRYSATHRINHDKIYRLDAVDAFQQKLVKKIEAVGIEVKGLGGSNPYLFLEGIDTSCSDPTARIDMQIKLQSGEAKRQVTHIKGRSRRSPGDDLYEKSNQFDAYQGFKVDVIDHSNGTVSFENGEVIHLHQATNDPTEADTRRFQIRQAIEAHFEKEQQLFDKQVKVLTLFFIDYVVKYRDYEREDEKGEYARIFEEEYQNILAQVAEKIPDDSPYKKYISAITAEETNRGYFSIDKKTSRLTDSTDREGSENNTSDYDLILRNKEQLLSFEEKTRFIFSHSALREGWDNPNVFVIGLLKSSGGTEIKRRQELGRGLRIAVDSSGARTDDNEAMIHPINTLTVVANESFKDYSEGLQKEIVDGLSGRQRKADEAFFTGQNVFDEEGNERKLTKDDAAVIYHHLILSGFIDPSKQILPLFREAHKAGTLEPLSGHLAPFSQAIFDLAGSILTDDQLPRAEDRRQAKTNPLKVENYETKAFREIWKRINHKALFEVEFDDDNLVTDCIAALDERLSVNDPHYVIIKGTQNTDATPDELRAGGAFTAQTSQRVRGGNHDASIDYNIVRKIADEVDLNRDTVTNIVKGMSPKKFELFKGNPEHFIGQVIAILKTAKASLLIKEITYSKTGETFDSNIFTAEISRQAFTKYVHEGQKHIYDYVLADSQTEQKLAEDMDADDSIIVYAKMPKGFYIPTPFGKYHPDWAICFDREKVKHIYFMAETKGTTDPSNLKAIEKAKTDCAKAFFKTVNEAINDDKVKYEVIATMDDLITAAELTTP